MGLGNTIWFTRRNSLSVTFTQTLTLILTLTLTVTHRPSLIGRVEDE